MTAGNWGALIPAIGALIAAATAWIRAEVANQAVKKHNHAPKLPKRR